MEQRVILEIASLCGVRVDSFGSFELSSIGIDPNNVHPEVAEYFGAHVPENPIKAEAFSDRDICRLYACSQLKQWNEDAVPSCDILRSGFVTIGTDCSGDAFAVDVRTGGVFLVSHEEDWEKLIPSEDADSDESRNLIIEDSTEIASSIGGFFETWLAQLRDVAKRESEFAAAAELDPNAVDESGNTQLVYLIRSGDTSAVREEIARGADLERLNRERRTAVGEAVAYGHLEIVELLLESGANPNARNDRGETPLMLGAHFAKVECIQALLKHGADLTATDDNGRKAFDRICSTHRITEIQNLLRS